MKNVTISLEDEVYERSRMLAVQEHKTLTALGQDYLTGLASAEDRRECARRELLAMIGKMGGQVGRMPTREDRQAH